MRQWLFQKSVDPVLKSHDCRFFVQVIGRGDQQAVEGLVVRDQLPEISVHGGIWMSKLNLEFLSSSKIRVTDCSNVDTFTVLAA
jgi:hypothetical protein